MKEMRRVLALLLCFVMLVGYVPVGALAAEAETTAPSVAEEPLVTEATDAVEDTTAAPEIETTASAETTEAVVETTAAVETTEAVEETTDPTVETGIMLTSSVEAVNSNTDIDYLFIATDRHTNTSIIGTMIDNMESDIGENELDYLGLGGDMVGSGNNNHPEYNSSTVLSEVTDATSSLSAVNVDIVAGIHDMNVNDDAGIVLSYNDATGKEIYEGDRFYVYGVPESCISEDFSESVWSAQSQAFVEWANGSSIDKSKAIIVLSHYPLHQRRDDNAGASYWVNALNTVAAGDDTIIDRNVAFFWGHNHTGETSEDTAVYHVAPEGSISVEGSSSSETIYFTYANAGYLNAKSSATLVKITDSTITFDKYVSSSVSTTNYVTRTVPAATLSSIAISGGNSYTVGEELALTVTATYSDGSTEDVTDAVEWSDLPDMTTAGTYNVTATYEGLTATYTIVVADPYVTGIAITTLPTTVTFDQGDELDTNGLVVTATYNNGTTAEVTPTSFTGYDMSKAGEQTVTVNYYVNGTTWSTTYTITVNEALADDVTLVSMEITTDPTTTEYQVNDALDISGMVVTATFSDNTTKELTYGGFIDSDGTSTVASDTFCYYIDGFNMHVEKQQEVVVSYTYGDKTLTDTFVINVWNYEFKDETTGVIVDVADGDYGVTGMTVADSTNNYVSTAIADYITGTNYKAYDITLTLDTKVNSEDSYILTSDAKTVTLPIPESVNNPVVCYVSDDGATVTNMNAVKDGKGNVTFTTTHFSTYVIGESTEIEVPENETASGSATTEGEKKTVYVLTSGITSGTSYLVVNGNEAGSYYALANNSGSVTATGVTVKTDDTIGTYIELDDATDELWTVASGYTFQNGSYYLGYTTSGSNWNQTYTFGLSTTSRSWSYSTSNHRLYTSIGNWNSTTYYLRYNDGWDWTSSNSASGRSVYFYVATEIDTSTTVEGTYTITGKDISAVVASVGSTTANLTAYLAFDNDDEKIDNTYEDVSTEATYLHGESCVYQQPAHRVPQFCELCSDGT